MIPIEGLNLSTRTLDYGSQAASRWVELGLDIDSLVLTTGIRLERIARRHELALTEAIAPFGHRGIRNMEDFRLLALFTRLDPACVSATEASRQLHISKAATAARVERFVEAELCVRSVRAHDRRSAEIHVTSTGKTLAKECHLAIMGAHHEMFTNLNEHELEQVQNLLGQI